jgi:hypothetical protein
MDYKEELKKALEGIDESRFAKYSDLRLQQWENHNYFMLSERNPNKGKVGYFKGKTFSEEHKKKIGEKHKGKVASKETLEKMSIASKGRKVSDETREKIRQKVIGVNLGRKHTDESKKRFSEIAKNRQYSEETRKKMSEKRKGKPVSDLAKQKALETNRKPVLCYSLPDMIFIREYESVQAAANDLNRDRYGIIKICKGRIKNPRKYFFKYK